MATISPTADTQFITPRRYQPFVTVLAAVALGIVLDSWFAWPTTCWCLFAAIALTVWWLSWRKSRDLVAAWVLLVSLGASGGAWHHVRWHLFADDELGRFAREQPEPVAVEAIALGGARRLPAPHYDPLRAIPARDRSRLKIALASIRDGDQWINASGKCTVLVDGDLVGVRAGDRLRIFGQLAAPLPAGNLGEFDFAQHARGDRILSRLELENPDCVTVLESASGFSIGRSLEAVRSAGDRLLWRHLQHDRSGLAAAVLLGLREELDTQRTDAFLTTGTVHILSISGLHVGILACLLFAGLRTGLLPRRTALIAVAMITLAYTLLTDAEPPAVRATILVIAICASQWMHRPGAVFNTLAAAALIVLALNPADLFRAGPQLSFLAAGCLAWLTSRWSDWVQQDPLDRLIAQTRPWPQKCARWSGRLMLRGIVASTLIWAVTLPLIASRFNLLQPIGLVLNPLLAFPVAVAMASGFAVMVLGWLVPPLAPAGAWLCDASLGLLDACVTRSAAIPLSHTWVPGPDIWWLAGFYALLALFAFGTIGMSRRWLATLLAAWIAVGFGAAWFKGRANEQLTATFLSVGHGSAVVIELPSGETMLYDAGRLGSPIAAARSISGYLWSRGRTHLDAVVISHADLDHYNALPELLERFSVGTIYVSPVMFLNSTPAINTLKTAIDKAGVPVQTVFNGDRFKTTGDVTIEVRHPPRRGLLGSDNANSIVLAIECQGQRILLTGDLESPGLEMVMEEEPWDCDVLLAPHHGSARSDPPGFAAWSRPELVVISGGYGADYEGVSIAYRSVRARILHTAVSGSVKVGIADGKMTVDNWRQPHQ